ncbi:UNVERIFIED_CONTAM: hypothetical protein K2H54_013886 [Gekko kuhli]
MTQPRYPSCSFSIFLASPEFSSLIPGFFLAHSQVPFISALLVAVTRHLRAYAGKGEMAVFSFGHSGFVSYPVSAFNLHCLPTGSDPGPKMQQLPAGFLEPSWARRTRGGKLCLLDMMDLQVLLREMKCTKCVWGGGGAGKQDLCFYCSVNSPIAPGSRSPPLPSV